MSKISLGFYDLCRAYIHNRNKSYHNEALKLNQTLQEVIDREYGSAWEFCRKKKMKGMLSRLQEEELSIKFKLNFPEEI